MVAGDTQYKQEQQVAVRVGLQYMALPPPDNPASNAKAVSEDDDGGGSDGSAADDDHSPRRTSAAAVAAAALAIGIDTTDKSVAKGAFVYTHTWAQKVQAAVSGG